MVIDELSPNASLTEFLHARAMHSSARRLGIDIVGGALIAGVTAWARPRGWLALLAAALCFLSYGAWAAAERHLQPAEWPGRIAREPAWRALHAAFAVVGFASFCVLLFAFLGLALGRIIS